MWRLSMHPGHWRVWSEFFSSSNSDGRRMAVWVHDKHICLLLNVNNMKLMKWDFSTLGCSQSMSYNTKLLECTIKIIELVISLSHHCTMSILFYHRSSLPSLQLNTHIQNNSSDIIKIFWHYPSSVCGLGLALAFLVLISPIACWLTCAMC